LGVDTPDEEDHIHRDSYDSGGGPRERRREEALKIPNLALEVAANGIRVHMPCWN
jgi:hypothetical protein